MLGCGLAYVRQVQVSAAETEEDGQMDTGTGKKR